LDDVRRLSEAAPFAWSSYQFTHQNNLVVLKQQVGPPSASVPSGSVNWTGDELVAVRLHIPSRIVYHNAGAPNLKRGNILVWEQTLTDRLRGAPLEIEARMETQSILYRTLWLFAGTVLAVAVTFGVVIWLVVRRGARGRPPAAQVQGRYDA
jgi:hypothetical protein